MRAARLLWRRVATLGLSLLLLSSFAQAQTAASGGEALLAAARKDGSLTLYTAFRPQDLEKVIAPFEAKYGVKVKAWRSGTNIVTQRVLREAAARRNEVDVIMIPAGDMEALYREKILQPMQSPVLADLIPGAVPKHQHWATVFMNVTVHSYNTQAIKKADLPKTYADLLDPKWKGNIGVEAKAEEWFAKVVMSLGEEKGLKLFNDIVTRNGLPSRVGVSLLHNLVIAGEVPLALTVYIDLPEKDKRAGKPVDWFVMEPVVAQGFNIGVAQRVQHSAAAQLFYDYMLSGETQKLLASLHYYPANSKVTSPYPDLRLDVVDPAYSVDNYAKWSKLFEDTLARQGKAPK
jgi:iron(III) transport system substrate-binding protein